MSCKEIPAFAEMERASALSSFHSGESRNLILATARIFREAEHCNGRLSANAAIANRLPRSLCQAATIG